MNLAEAYNLVPLTPETVPEVGERVLAVSANGRALMCWVRQPMSEGILAFGKTEKEPGWMFHSRTLRSSEFPVSPTLYHHDPAAWSAYCAAQDLARRLRTVADAVIVRGGLPAEVDAAGCAVSALEKQMGL